MRILRHYSPFPPDMLGATVALGNFDGVHRGHQAVIARALAEAQCNDTPHGVVTFEPHPRQVFRPDDPPFRLTPFRVKCHALQALGLNFMLSLPFDRAFSTLTAAEFVDGILHRALGVRHLVIGYDFVFGQGRTGNAALLTAMGAQCGFAVSVVDAVHADDGVIFSSTRIRSCLQQGDALGAAALLGRPWEIEGRVDHGDARGRLIGFPTANLALSDYVRPASGVYAVRVGVETGGQLVWHAGVANIGSRPTVNGTDIRLEAHLFDFSGDLYGQMVRVALIDWIRPERRFDGLEALTRQIATDAAEARRRLGQR